MKRILLLAFLLVNTLCCVAQGVYAAVYSKGEDVIKNHFAFKFNCDSGKVRVSLGKKITVHQRKKSHSFAYGDVYGYRSCDGKVFRILNKTAYEIINTEEIILYSTENVISKSSEVEKRYFFSLSLAGSLKALTIQNVIAAYSGNHTVNDKLHEYFKDDDELVRYNKSLKKYEIVHLLQDARKK